MKNTIQDHGVYGFDIFEENKEGKTVRRETIAVKADNPDHARQLVEKWAKDIPEFFSNPRLVPSHFKTILDPAGNLPRFEKSDEYDDGHVRRLRMTL